MSIEALMAILGHVTPEMTHSVLVSQLADVIELRDDAQHRGWTDETTRHQHVADAITGHLRTIENQQSTNTTS